VLSLSVIPSDPLDAAFSSLSFIISFEPTRTSVLLEFATEEAELHP
jgi:hypothetical protein